MGMQQSLIKFKDKETLVSELKKYVERDTSNNSVYLICVNKVIKDLYPFTEGELILVIGGERFEQRFIQNLKNASGIENIDSIVFVDNPTYLKMSDGDISVLLDNHFRTLSKNETDDLIKL